MAVLKFAFHFKFKRKSAYCLAVDISKLHGVRVIVISIRAGVVYSEGIAQYCISLQALDKIIAV